MACASSVRAKNRELILGRFGGLVKWGAGESFPRMRSEGSGCGSLRRRVKP